MNLLLAPSPLDAAGDDSIDATSSSSVCSNASLLHRLTAAGLQAPEQQTQQASLAYWLVAPRRPDREVPHPVYMLCRPRRLTQPAAKTFGMNLIYLPKGQSSTDMAHLIQTRPL